MKISVFDFHAHVGRWGNTAVFDDVDSYISVMNSAGIDKANVNCIFHSKASVGNDLTYQFIEKYPDRFIGVGFVSPHYPEEVIPELERIFNCLKMKSLKVYPDYYGKPIDDEGYLPVFEWCDHQGIVIMSHSSANDGFHLNNENNLTEPQRFVSLAKRFPNITWVLAHSGNGRIGQLQAVNAAKTCPNIFLETCTSFGDHNTITDLVNGAGEDRILFGSDMPLMDPRGQIGRIVSADISLGAKKKILGLNAIKVLGLE